MKTDTSLLIYMNKQRFNPEIHTMEALKSFFLPVVRFQIKCFVHVLTT